MNLTQCSNCGGPVHGEYCQFCGASRCFVRPFWTPYEKLLIGIAVLAAIAFALGIFGE